MRALLRIFDMEAGTARTVLETPRHIEAPNWSRDGKRLIVNAEGRLWSVATCAPALDPLDTGDCTALNNDHGLSPDGSRIALSHKTDGESCIYVMDAGGGTPRRVTPNTPSWWHGWSPDGETLTYTARRDGTFGIWTIPATGGAEICLIEGGGHYDGPDYSADGRWIWFNSDRAGTMDLWRIPATGGAAQRMTRGEGSDWFPHPGPDGTVVYLCYPEGVDGHPPDRDVELRALDPGRITPRTLHAFRGGQGSLNVPSWHPDGRRFAYVEYPQATAQQDRQEAATCQA